MKDILGLDFLKICRKYRSNGVLFPEIHYICRANRCVCMQPLAEKCFHLTNVVGEIAKSNPTHYKRFWE